MDFLLREVTISRILGAKQDTHVFDTHSIVYFPLKHTIFSQEQTIQELPITGYNRRLKIACKIAFELSKYLTYLKLITNLDGI